MNKVLRMFKQSLWIIMFLKFILALAILLYYISYISSLLSLFCLAIVLFCLTKILIRIIIFPGSFFMYRRSIEKHYTKNLSLKLLSKIEDLRFILVSLISSDQNNRSSSTQEIFEFISKTIKNLQFLESKHSLSASQQVLLKQLQKLSIFLSEAHLKYNETSISFKDWMSERPCSISQLSMTEEGFTMPSGSLSLIENLLKNSENLLGSFEYMRADILNTLSCEQLWLEMDDHTNIDW